MRRPTRGALAAHSRSFEKPRYRTGQFLRSFVLSCVRLWNGPGCINLSLVVKVWVLLKLQPIAFFYKIDCPLFLLALRLFLLIFLFFGTLDSIGVLWTFRLYAFTHVVLGLVFLWDVLVGSHICIFRHGVRHLRLATQSS